MTLKVMEYVASTLQEEPQKFEKAMDSYKNGESTKCAVYQDKPMPISLVKIFRNYSTVEKYLMYRYSIKEPNQKIEESYALKEIRADHSLITRKVSLITLVLKGLIMAKSSQLIFNVTSSIPLAIFGFISMQYLFDSHKITQVILLPRISHYLKLL